MFGITLGEFANFINQIGLAIAGAASLWGLIFFRKSKSCPEDERICLKDVAGRMFTPLAVGFSLVLVAIFLNSMFNVPVAYSHEGIVIANTQSWASAALEIKTPILWMFVLVTFVGMYLSRFNQQKLAENYGLFFFVELIIVSFLISLPAWVGGFGSVQSFFIGHSLHSILTVGTVVIVDYLFHISHKNPEVRRVLFPNMGLMSKVIWIGLGIEFASVLLIFPDALNFTDKFYFMQIVIGILIINGAVLSGPMARRMQTFENNREKVDGASGNYGVIIGLSGVVSIVSWLSITFVDSFSKLSLSFDQLFIAYFACLILGGIFYFTLERSPGSAM